MQQEMTVRDQVQAIVAGRIVKKLAKLGASEEGQLRGAVGTVVRGETAGEGFASRHTTAIRLPASVVDATIRTLGSIGHIRRISYGGKTYVARHDATHEEVAAAVKLSIGEARYAAYAATKRGRRQRYGDGETGFEVAVAMPLTGPDAEVHYSEREDALTYEGSVADDPFEAEIPSASEAAGTPVDVGRRLVVTDEVRAKIRYQDRIGQGARNTRRARARYLKTNPAMQQWLARKEMEETARREERRAFRAADSHTTANAPAMSPEQAHADHHSD